MKMKTLTLNGVTYQVCDPAAVSVEAQTLTEEQKQQALQNLGIPEKTYELIEDVTLTQSVASFVRTADLDGNAYNFSAVRILVMAAAGEATTALTFRLSNPDNEYMLYHDVSGGISTSPKRTCLIARNDHGRVDYHTVSASGSGSASPIARPWYLVLEPWRDVNRISVSVGSGAVIPAGTQIVIYAVRG